MKTLYKKLIITSAFLLALSAGFPVLIPEAGAIGSGTVDISLNVSPQYPSAGENFTVKAKSFTFDPMRAKFQWQLNGKLEASGVGLTEHVFTASKLGSQMTIKTVATLNNGASYQALLTVNIADIDLIVRPLTYTPLFYRGSSFASPGSSVEIYAVPHLFSGSTRIAANNLIYEWSVDGRKSTSLSGEGKSKFILTMADAGNISHDVALKVSSVGGSVSMQKNIRARTESPQILFYEINTLTGRSNLARSSYTIQAGGGLSVLAEPYYFDIASMSRAVISWSANGAIIEPTAENPRILEIVAPENSYSTTAFGFSVENKKTIYQRAAGALTITAIE